MDDAYQLTIIIPHHNIPDLLGNLLQSIPERDDIQIIVVDDHSTEHVEQLDAVIQNSRNRNLEFYRNKTVRNSPGTCRNIGLDHAKGQWILFADADDYYVDGWFEKLEPFFHGDYEIIYFEPTSIRLDTGEKGTRHEVYQRAIRAFIADPSPEHELRLRYGFSATWFKAYSRKFLLACGARFDDVLISEDALFSMTCGRAMCRFICIDEEIYCVTQRNGSLITLRELRVYDEQTRMELHRYHNLYQWLSPLEIRAIGMEFAGLRILYRTVANGYGFRQMLTYWELMRQEQVPLVSWKSCSVLELARIFFCSVRGRIADHTIRGGKS